MFMVSLFSFSFLNSYAMNVFVSVDLKVVFNQKDEHMYLCFGFFF